jgi:predicted DNA-binding transcriptional regulator AlpA
VSEPAELPRLLKAGDVLLGIARELAVSWVRAERLMSEPDFPAPVALPSGKFWTASDVAQWLRDHFPAP